MNIYGFGHKICFTSWTLHRPSPFFTSSTLHRLSAESCRSSTKSCYLSSLNPSNPQFPDHLLLILSARIGKGEKNLVCVYHRVKEETFALPSISTDEFNEFRSIVRCPNTPVNYSSYVDLQFHGDSVMKKKKQKQSQVHNWEKIGYEAVINGDTVVVFVKGLNRRPHKESDPSYDKYQFQIGNSEERDDVQVLMTKAVAGQEVVRCVFA